MRGGGRLDDASSTCRSSICREIVAAFYAAAAAGAGDFDYCDVRRAIDKKTCRHESVLIYGADGTGDHWPPPTRTICVGRVRFATRLHAVPVIDCASPFICVCVQLSNSRMSAITSSRNNSLRKYCR